MAKVIVEATKLADATVNYISLVKRGANRIPFRIIKSDKQENGMIDLGKIFKTADGAPAKKAEPTVAGLVVAKSEFLDEVKEAVQKSGFSVDHIEEREDGTVVFKQEEGELNFDTLSVFKMSDESLVLMAGVEKADGIPAPLNTAIGNLGEILIDTITKGEDGYVAKMEEALKAFNSYAIDVATKVPASVFKADIAINEVIKASKDKMKDKSKDMMGQHADAGMEDDEDKMMEGKDKEKAKKEEEATPAADSATASDAAPVIDVAEVVKAALESALAPITASISAVSASVEAVTKQVSEVSEAQKSMATKMEEVEAVAKSADASIKGTVVGAAPAGDTIRHQTVDKSEGDDPYSGVFDTAFIARKSAAGRGQKRH